MKNNNKFSWRSKGFTLIELLVVIAIIGILSGIVYANFGDARAGARDQARMVNLKEMQLAIELYKAQNGRYPEACQGVNSWSGGVSGSFVCDGNEPYITGLVPDYIPALPYDTNILGNRGYLYRVDSTRTSYKLMANRVVEKKLVTSYEDEFARCPESFGRSYCGVTPQADTYAVYGGPASAGW